MVPREYSVGELNAALGLVKNYLKSWNPSTDRIGMIGIVKTDFGRLVVGVTEPMLALDAELPRYWHVNVGAGTAKVLGPRGWSREFPLC